MPLKESLTKDFQLQAFFIYQFPQGSRESHWAISDFYTDNRLHRAGTLCIGLLHLPP